MEIFCTASGEGIDIQRDSTPTRHLDIYDVKTPQDHNKHGENFQKNRFQHFFLIFSSKSSCLLSLKLGQGVQDLSLKSGQGVQDLSLRAGQGVQDLSLRAGQGVRNLSLKLSQGPKSVRRRIYVFSG